MKLAVLRIVSGLLLVALVLPVSAAEGPTKRLRAFLDTHGNQSGLPTGDGVAAVGAFLSRELNAAFEHARDEQARFIAKHPDEKPPFIEGPLFNSSGYEPFTAYAPVLPADGCAVERCTIRVDFVDTVASPDVLWHDEFVMVRENGEWRIDDVIYRAGFAYGNHGSLRANLSADGDAAAGE